MHKIVKKIFIKYEGVLPRYLSNQKMNEYLKEIASLTGLDQKIYVAIAKGGRTIENIHAKFGLVTTHTARRSFVTNAYLMDVPSTSFMKITGHRTEKSFMKYICISQEDNDNKLLNHPFIN